MCTLNRANTSTGRGHAQRAGTGRAQVRAAPAPPTTTLLFRPPASSLAGLIATHRCGHRPGTGASSGRATTAHTYIPTPALERWFLLNKDLFLLLEFYLSCLLITLKPIPILLYFVFYCIVLLLRYLYLRQICVLQYVL